MKLKRIKVGVKNAQAALDDFVRIGEAIMLGHHPKRESRVYFENYEFLRKTLTPKRMELLQIIKADHPTTTNELARKCKRNIRNVAADLRHLERIGLVDFRADKSRNIFVVPYDRIVIEIFF